MNVADVLADVCPDDIAPSIQSAPLGFKPRVTGDDVVASYHRSRPAGRGASDRAGGAHRAHGARSRSSRSRTAILETTDETVEYFTQSSLLRRRGRDARQARRTFRSRRRISALRRHVGIVFDICHQAVEYENIAEVAAEAGRRRHSDLQAAGSRRAAHAGSDAKRSSIRSNAMPRRSISRRPSRRGTAS